MLVFLWYGGAEYDVFDINQSFFILFMVIIGGLGSLIGSFFGAALIFILPIVLGIVLPAIFEPFGISIGAGRHRAPALHDRRRAHHLLPDRRAARPRAALADRQTEAPGLAVPLLNGRPPTAERVEETSGSLKKPLFGPALREEMKCRSETQARGRGGGPARGPRSCLPLAQDSIYVPLLTYRTGPFAGSGIPIADGMHDYLRMLNERDGGIGGVKLVIEECETGYDTKKGRRVL